MVTWSQTLLLFLQVLLIDLNVICFD